MVLSTDCPVLTDIQRERDNVKHYNHQSSIQYVFFSSDLLREGHTARCSLPASLICGGAHPGLRVCIAYFKRGSTT